MTMVQSRKINDEIVAVSFAPTEILVRHSGKENYGKEESLVRFDGDRLLIEGAVAKEYGIEISVI